MKGLYRQRNLKLSFLALSLGLGTLAQAACPNGYLCGSDGGAGGNASYNAAGSGGVNADATATYARNGGAGGCGAGQGDAGGGCGFADNYLGGVGGGSDSGGGGGSNYYGGGGASAGGSGGGGGAGGSEGQLAHIPGSLGSSLGGNGGSGGSSWEDPKTGGAGGGGGGGSGAALDGGLSYNIAVNVTIRGGSGGAGKGMAGRNASSSGNGGYGLRVGNGASLVNNGAIFGGNGGANVAGRSSGGIGIIGKGLTIVNSGAISGGLAGDGTTRAAAIRFTGGTNALVLQGNGTIVGTVDATAGIDDTLTLGGSTDSKFDLNQAGDGGQFVGFQALGKNGTSSWSLTGSTALPLNLSAGTIVVGNPSVNGGIAAVSMGSLTWNGGAAIGMQLGAAAAGSDVLNISGVLAPAGSGTYRFHFSDGVGTPGCGTTYPLIRAAGINTFVLRDFSFDYSGANTNFHGVFAINGNDLLFETTKCQQAITAFSATPASTIYAPSGTFTVSAAAGDSANPVTFTIAAASASVCALAPAPAAANSTAARTVAPQCQGWGNGAGTAPTACNNGTYTANIAIRGAGVCSVLANQAGNTTYQDATPLSLPVTIAKAAQTIDFGAQPAQTFVKNGTFAIAPAATASSGLAVNYSVATASAAVCSLNGTTVTMLAAGTCTVAADQAGNANYNAATQVVQSIAIGSASSTVSLSANPSSATVGQTVVFTATVNGQAATGTITFKDAANTLCAGPVAIVAATSTATCSTTLSLGSHSVVAIYSGDANNSGPQSSAAVSVSVALNPATMNLVATPNPVTQGQALTLTATVGGNAPASSSLAFAATAKQNVAPAAAATPTGSVTFYDAAAVLGSSNLDAGGMATLSIASLSVGTHQLSATYAGDGMFAQTTMAAAVAVNAAAPAVPAPALSSWMLILLGGLLASLALQRCAKG